MDQVHQPSNQVHQLSSENLALPTTSTSRTLEPSKKLCGLPNELWLTILANVPVTRGSISNLRLVCRAINNLTYTKEFHRELIRTQFSDTGHLFFAGYSAIEAFRAKVLQDQLDECIRTIMFRSSKRSYPVSNAIRSIVRRGIALIWFLAHHALESRTSSAVANALLNLSRSNCLCLAAILTIRIATTYLFACISGRERRGLIKSGRSVFGVTFSQPDIQDNERLFLAFEAAIFWTKRNHTDRGFMLHDPVYMIDTLSAMVDPSGTGPIHLENYNMMNPISMHEPWTVITSLLKEKSSSSDKFQDVIGDLTGLTDIEVILRLRKPKNLEEHAKEVLEDLDLEKIGQNARLQGTVFRTPSLRLWLL